MGFNITESYTDPALVSNGVWVDFYGDSKLLIACDESPKYKAQLSRLAQNNKVRLDTTNEDTVELVKKITCESMAKHILLDWKGIEEEDGKEVPYSREKAFEYLMESSMLRSFVQDQAGRTDLFRSVTAEEVGKLSTGPSAGETKAAS